MNKFGIWKSINNDPVGNERAEAKYECAIKNNVVIITGDEYNRYINYVLEKYGNDFFKRYKK